MSLHWGPLDHLAIVLILSWPGILLGTLYGAVGWRAHRISGGVLGAIIGCLVCLAAFFAWNASDLSMTLSFPEIALLPLREGLPGLLAGLFVGASLWRERRIFGAACGALLGATLWLSGWFYFEGHHFHRVGDAGSNSAAPAELPTDRAREPVPDAKASQRMTIETFLADLLRASRFDDTGRGADMRRWLKRSAQAWLAGERIYSAPEIKVVRRSVGSNVGKAKAPS